MTQEWIIKTLVSLGLSPVDAEIYAFLAVEGPQNGRNIAETLKLNKHQLYRSLKRLKAKKIVNSSFGYPSFFSSVAFEGVLDLFLEVKKKKADILQQSREDLVSKWQDITKKGNNS